MFDCVHSVLAASASALLPWQPLPLLRSQRSTPRSSGRWLVFWFVYTVPFALIGTFKDDNAIAVVPASALLTFGYYGLDYCANQLQVPTLVYCGITPRCRLQLRCAGFNTSRLITLCRLLHAPASHAASTHP